MWGPAPHEGVFMARFFFHFVYRGGWVADGEGSGLNELRDAHRHAMLLIEQATLQFEDIAGWRDWVIQITDVCHRPVLTVLFPARKPRRVSEGVGWGASDGAIPA
jgi:hypothetical protein